jgi:hypothetical protein
MHILPVVRQHTITVEMDDGKVFEVLMDGGGAWVPKKLADHMIRNGLARQGDQMEFPKPVWNQHINSGPMGGITNGAAVGLWDRWVKEVTNK